MKKEQQALRELFTEIEKVAKEIGQKYGVTIGIRTCPCGLGEVYCCEPCFQKEDIDVTQG